MSSCDCRCYVWRGRGTFQSTCYPRHAAVCCLHVIADACGGSVEGERGTFQSPGYPKKYPRHAACMWRVQTPVGTKVQLQVGFLACWAHNYRLGWLVHQSATCKQHSQISAKLLISSNNEFALPAKNNQSAIYLFFKWGKKSVAGIVHKNGTKIADGRSRLKYDLV